MRHSLGAILRDPLLIKEFRTRMRARTVLIVELLYVVAVCGIVFLGYLFTRGGEDTPGWELGGALFRTITVVQAMLMFFVSPLVAASALSGEKEQKTFDTLMVTPVSPRRVVLAKLAAALGCFVVLVLASLPFACASFILGGVAPTDIGLAYALTLLCTAAAAAMGLYWSTRFERSIASIPAAAVCAVGVLLVAAPLDESPFRALTGVSPLVFLKMLYEGTTIPFYGRAWPFWAPSVAFLGLGFVYLMVAARVRLQFAQERAFVLHRLLGLALLTAAAAFAYGGRMRPVGDPPTARQLLTEPAIAMMIGLAALAPWVGANVPVFRSRLRLSRERPLIRAAGTALVRPDAFMALAVLVSAPFLALGLQVIGPTNLAPLAVWGFWYGVVGLSTVTWSLLAVRLADGATVRRRFVGMAAAYAVMAAALVGPLLVFHRSAYVSEGVPRPAWVQYASLVSPLMSVENLQTPSEFVRSHPAVVGGLGPHGGVKATAGLYALAAAALLRAGRRVPSGRSPGGVTHTEAR